MSAGAYPTSVRSVPDGETTNVLSLVEHANLDEKSKVIHRLLHKTIKAVTHDLHPDRYVFNTAIARCHELVSALYKYVAELYDAQAVRGKPNNGSPVEAGTADDAGGCSAGCPV